MKIMTKNKKLLLIVDNDLTKMSLNLIIKNATNTRIIILKFVAEKSKNPS